MASTAFQLTIKYTVIGEHHLLVHLFGCKIDVWMLLDLGEITSQTGKSYDEVIQKLCGWGEL